jgi:hypothetical protein
MTDPTPTVPPPADDPQGSLGAVLIGGAILLIAGLFIFWPDNDNASNAARTAAGKGAAAVQGSNTLAGDGKGGANGGLARGIDPRDHDPARGAEPVNPNRPRITPGLMAQDLGMAPPPPPPPTSFASKAEEIAYVEKQVAQARLDLDTRAVFVERMTKIQQQGKNVEEDERNAARAKVVQQNYEAARLKLEALEQRLKLLRGA